MHVFVAYVHHWYFARLSNKKYSEVSEEWLDNEVFFTVSSYSEDSSIASKQERFSRDAVKGYCILYPSCDVLLHAYSFRYFDKRLHGTSWEDVEKCVHSALFQLLNGAKEIIGEWPRSCAYYAVDVIIEDRVAAMYAFPLTCELPRSRRLMTYRQGVTAPPLAYSK